MEKEPLTREFGFFIVTATRKTDHCDILCTVARKKSLVPGASAGSPVVGNAQASGHFSKEDKFHPGWIRRPTVSTSYRFANEQIAAGKLHRLR